MIKIKFFDFCQYFNSEELMIAHRLVRHSTNSTNSSASSTGKSGGAASEKTYECDVCTKTFNKHSSWWKHKKCHTGERAYKCFQCDRDFSQAANLQRVILLLQLIAGHHFEQTLFFSSFFRIAHVCSFRRKTSCLVINVSFFNL